MKTGLPISAFDAPECAKDDSAIITKDGQQIAITPIIYEDFLPVSAAGIFQSNLGDDATQPHHATASKTAFEQALGTPVIDEFALYQSIQDDSLRSRVITLAYLSLSKHQQLLRWSFTTPTPCR